MKKETCQICHEIFDASELKRANTINQEIVNEITKVVSDWTTNSVACHNCLSGFRVSYVKRVLLDEKGELTDLEQRVLDSLRKHDTVSSNTQDTFKGKWTFGEILADKIATFGGSWTFLICFSAGLFSWIIMNSVILIEHPFDAYPYILLNLILSCIASVQAPIIMMSQKRQEARDRVRSENDYKVNLKAELEIRHLHEKIDHLTTQQWKDLINIQQLQLEAISDLNNN